MPRRPAQQPDPAVKFLLVVLFITGGVAGVVIPLVPLARLLAGFMLFVPFPLTLVALCAYPILVTLASRGLADRALWLFLAIVPIGAFLAFLASYDEFLQWVGALTGAGSPRGNLDPPIFAGYLVGLAALYIAAVTGAFLVRLGQVDRVSQRVRRHPYER